MKTIAIANRRGGVGKTVTAHSLGAGLVRRGFRVLFIDLDSQANLTFDLGGSSGRYTSMEVLTGSATAADAIQHTAGGDLLPGAPSLSAADVVIDGTGKEYRLREALAPISSEYDYAVIDTPPALGVLTVNALTASDGVIIPVQAEVHSLQGVGLIFDTIEPVRKYCNPSLRVLGFLLTRYNSRAVISKDMRANLEAQALALGTKVFETAIRECTAVKEAQACQQDIFAYAPKSNAAADYELFLGEVIACE